MPLAVYLDDLVLRQSMIDVWSEAASPRQYQIIWQLIIYIQLLFKHIRTNLLQSMHTSPYNCIPAWWFSMYVFCISLTEILYGRRQPHLLNPCFCGFLRLHSVSQLNVHVDNHISANEGNQANKTIQMKLRRCRNTNICYMHTLYIWHFVHPYVVYRFHKRNMVRMWNPVVPAQVGLLCGISCKVVSCVGIDVNHVGDVTELLLKW